MDSITPVATTGTKCQALSGTAVTAQSFGVYLVVFAISTSFLALVYSLGFAPKQTASSPSFTCKESASVSVNTTTVWMPRPLADRITRRAISPLFAMRTFAFELLPAGREFRPLQMLCNSLCPFVWTGGRCARACVETVQVYCAH